MKNIIIDFEFTGIDSSFTTDNEIVQCKAMNTDTGQTISVNFSSDKEINAYSYLIHKTKRYEGIKFSKMQFIATLSRIDSDIDDSFYGFGTTQDKLMLKKYDIDIEIKDMREILQLSEYDSKMAIEGSGLEVVYYIVTGKIPESTSHNGVDELHLMKEIYDEIINIKPKQYFEVMPHGHCAGMPLEDYVERFRRAADGYRFNNNDLLSRSLSNEIEKSECIDRDIYGDEEGDDEEREFFS